jgi:hypothetical protein
MRGSTTGRRASGVSGLLHLWLALGVKLRGGQELLLMGLLLGRNVLGGRRLSLMREELSLMGEELLLMGVLLGRNVLGEQSLGINTRWRDCARRSLRCSKGWRDSARKTSQWRTGFACVRALSPRGSTFLRFCCSTLSPSFPAMGGQLKCE